MNYCHTGSCKDKKGNPVALKRIAQSLQIAESFTCSLYESQ